jgi:dihydropteroate synthase
MKAAVEIFTFGGGISIFRVHDVAEMVDFIKVTNAVNDS